MSDAAAGAEQDAAIYQRFPLTDEELVPFAAAAWPDDDGAVWDEVLGLNGTAAVGPADADAS